MHANMYQIIWCNWLLDHMRIHALLTPCQEGAQAHNGIRNCQPLSAMPAAHRTADKITDTTSSHAAAPSSDAFGEIPHHDDIHGVPYDADSERSSGLRLNYLGLAALACVILYLVLKDKMGGKAKIGSPRSLPAHSRDGARW